MKMIKNVIVLALFTLTLTGAFAQSGETKKLLINKWIVDKEAMKPVVEIMLATNPQTAGLDEVNKQVAINTALEQISGMKIEYKADGTYSGVNSNGAITGTWSLSADGKEFKTKSADKPEKKFTVVAVSKTKLHLIGEGNRELFLKAENQ